MKIALLGAGAVGGYFIWGFENADLQDRQFVVIAEGERLERLRRDGIKVNGTVYHPSVMSPDEAGVQDLIIVSVKGNTLKDAVKLLPPLVGENTVALSMLNGGDSEEIIADQGAQTERSFSIRHIIQRSVTGQRAFPIRKGK